MYTFVEEISVLFDYNAPSAQSAGSILSLLAESKRNDFNVNQLAQILVKAIHNEHKTWDYPNYIGAIERKDNTDFAAMVTIVLPEDKRLIVVEWMKKNFKSLCEVASAETICSLHFLTPEIFDKYKSKPYVSRDFQGECNLAQYLKNIYISQDYPDLTSRIEAYAETNLCLKFMLHPIEFKEYNDKKFKPECFEWLKDKEIQLICDKQEALSAMKRYADNSRYGFYFKKRLTSILWKNFKS